MRRPTFFEHFDGVAVDWRYLDCRQQSSLEFEGAWLARQGARVFVDASSGVNLYPDLRLVNNDEAEFARSTSTLTQLMNKMASIGARDLILSLHRTPENNFSWEQTRASFVSTLRLLCQQAASLKITVHLRISLKAMPEPSAMVALVEEVGLPNLRLAPSLALLLHQQVEPATLPPSLGSMVGLWCVSLPAYDHAGALYSLNAPLATDPDSVRKLTTYLQSIPTAPLLLDSAPANWAHAYEEIRALEMALQ